MNIRIVQLFLLALFLLSSANTIFCMQQHQIQERVRNDRCINNLIYGGMASLSALACITYLSAGHKDNPTNFLKPFGPIYYWVIIISWAYLRGHLGR